MEKQIDDLVSDREKFNKFICIPIDEAISKLKERQQNAHLEKY